MRCMTMAVNRGKQFEQQVRNGFNGLHNTLCMRLPDPMGAYAGVKNPCDLVVYHNPIFYCIECKTTSTSTLPFAHISDNQWKSLGKAGNIDGVLAGVMVWYVNHDKTYFVPIQELERLREGGHKSLNLKMFFELSALGLNFMEIYGRKKRLFFDYNMNDFLLTAPEYLKVYILGC